LGTICPAAPACAAERRSSRALDGLDEVVGGAVKDLAQRDEHLQVQPLGLAGHHPPDL